MDVAAFSDDMNKVPMQNSRMKLNACNACNITHTNSHFVKISALVHLIIQRCYTEAWIHKILRVGRDPPKCYNKGEVKRPSKVIKLAHVNRK